MIHKLKDNFILGGDPEFFCKDLSKDKYISLVKYLTGTKEQPSPIGVKGCFDLIDNVSVEFNMPPVPEFWMLHTLIEECITYTNKWLKEKNRNFTLDITSSAVFEEDQLKTVESMKFGCEPAYSIYNWKEEIIRPEPIMVGGLRTASYHIHYGWEDNYSADTLRWFILLNDVFLGFPALFLDKSDIERKKMYGSLGEHRLKHPTITEYHDIESTNRIEYRTLGAGIHSFPGFVARGIELVRKNVENIQDFVDEYYLDFTELNKNINNTDLIEDLKNKLIKNEHYNR